ncbi:MAG: metalloregulator ArsR/SmtB family transcription factor [Eubacteriales bacterium]|nr:metalloregulator ArsR/SmtB family transcription factor [Eubacteriales bacterium]
MNKEYVIYARIFKAMSDENRLHILEYLSEKDHNASELLERMDFGQSTLSHHMQLLQKAGIVESRRNGKWTIYHLNRQAYEDMMDWMERYL